MAINVSAANNQAAQLNDNISKLREAKRHMQAYRSSVSNNWKGKETTYILTAIDQVIGNIDTAIRNLDSLSRDIKNVASQIKREEEAAARAREKQQRIQNAQNVYNSACNELNSLMDARGRLIDALHRAPRRDQARIFNEIKALENTIHGVEAKVRSAADALAAAKR